MHVVLDTNVLVSALLTPTGNPARILDLVLAFKLQPLFDDRVIAEYREVLTRDKFGFSPQDVNTLLTFIQAAGQFILTIPTDAGFPDAGDAKFYELHLSGPENYLITGNLKHFPRSPHIVNPANFLKIYLSRGK